LSLYSNGLQGRLRGVGERNPPPFGLSDLKQSLAILKRDGDTMRGYYQSSRYGGAMMPVIT